MNRRTALKALASVPLVFAAPAVAAKEALRAHKALHIWRTETDFTIAESAEHASVLAIEMMVNNEGLWKSEWRSEGDGTEPGDWEMWPDDKLFPLTEEVDEEADPDATFLAKHLTSPSINEAYLYPGEKVPTQLGKPRPDARVVWHVTEPKGGPYLPKEQWRRSRIWHRTTQKLPVEWIAEHPVGFLASTEA